VLQSRIAAVEEEKVAAQKANHDLQLQIREGSLQSAHVTHVKDVVPVMPARGMLTCGRLMKNPMTFDVPIRRESG
jgi:hypothetical protein